MKKEKKGRGKKKNTLEEASTKSIDVEVEECEDEPENKK